jgi:hypothetical protein
MKSKCNLCGDSITNLRKELEIEGQGFHKKCYDHFIVNKGSTKKAPRKKYRYQAVEGGSQGYFLKDKHGRVLTGSRGPIIKEDVGFELIMGFRGFGKVGFEKSKHLNAEMQIKVFKQKK